jgi:xanthine/CO dehydrogenase XdhC/CoxF family maturation factor
MKELQAMIEEFEQSDRNGRTTALATVIEVRGSTYRRPGARMLITQDGVTVGAISGGCLEADVFEQAQQVMTSGEPKVVTYDTTAPDDIVWGLGLGCNGLVSVLIEPLAHKRQPNPMTFLADCFRLRQMSVVATVVRVAGQVQEQVGTRLMLQPDGNAIGRVKNSALAASILEDAQAAMHNSRSTLKSYQLPLGYAEVFIEAIQPPVPLVIFGAGYDAVPLVRLAKELGWHVTVVDSRQSDTTKERFPLAHSIVLSRPASIAKHITIDHHTVAVVMAHNYLHDREILKTLLPSPLQYLGILGPQSRTERLLQELREAGINPTAEQMQRLYSPVGLDIGAETPEAIALSIVAEMQAAIANRSGGLLRDRKGPIHHRIQEQNIQPERFNKEYVGA